MAEHTLDLRGEICPYPLTETRKKVGQLQPGDKLTVLVDYPLAVDNVPRWAKGAGHGVTVTKTEATEWEIVIDVSG